MASTPGEIPGFYFDPEKRKYFRIQPNHRAPPGAPHSRGAIAAKSRAEEIQNEARSKQTRDERGTIKRIIDKGSFTKLDLDLRTGAHPRRRNLDNLAKHYAASLRCRTATQQDGVSIESITLSREGALYGTLSRRQGVFEVVNLSSIDATLHSSKRRAWFASDPGTSARARTEIADGTIFASAIGSKLTVGGLPDAQGVIEEDPQQQYDFRCTIWDLAAPNVAFPDTLAIATENGLTIIPSDVVGNGGSSSRLKTEQMTLNYQDANVVMSGERDGTVNFTDVRESSTVARLRHNYAVNGIVVGRHASQVIVSGLQSVSVYDLRYTKAVERGPELTHKRRKIHGNSTAAAVNRSRSQPLVRFDIPDERQSDHYGPGKSLAYIPYLDIAVVVSHRSDHGSRWENSEDRSSGSQDIVTLYDASKGRMLASPITPARFGQINALAVGMARDGPESIFIGTKKSVHEWAVDLPWTQAQDQEVRQLVVDRDEFPPDHEPGMIELRVEGDCGPG